MSEYGEELPYTRPFAKVYVTDTNGNRVVHEVYGNIKIPDIALLRWFGEVKEIHDFEYCNGQRPVNEGFLLSYPPIGQRNEKERKMVPLRGVKPMSECKAFEIGTFDPKDWTPPSQQKAKEENENE